MTSFVPRIPFYAILSVNYRSVTFIGLNISEMENVQKSPKSAKFVFWNFRPGIGFLPLKSVILGLFSGAFYGITDTRGDRGVAV